MSDDPRDDEPDYIDSSAEDDIDPDEIFGTYPEQEQEEEQEEEIDQDSEVEEPEPDETELAEAETRLAEAEEANADAGGETDRAEEVAQKPAKKQKSGFFPLVNKGTREVKQSSAGAGFIGLIGFSIMLLVASIFFITENYFISMFTISVGLLIYVAGTDLIVLAFSTFVIFFSSKHLNNRATAMQHTAVALKNILNIKRDRDGTVAVGPIDNKVSIELPDNPLSRDIQELVTSGRTFDYAEFVAHDYYQECHELYESSSSNFDFVSATMPLFGLIGTIIGLIAMFDSLGSDVTVESLSPQLALALKTTLYGAIFSSFYKIIGTRFERRMVDLDYDYDAFCRALQVIVENRNRIEIDR